MNLFPSSLPCSSSKQLFHCACLQIYLAGESYAGQHIPYIAKHVLERNSKADAHDQWNLRGLLIGNGWISPREQYHSYLQFAYEKRLIEKGTSLSNELQGIWRNCERQIATQPDRIDLSECEAILTSLLAKTKRKDENGNDVCYNMYDVRLTDLYNSCGMNWPPDLEFVTPYLRRDDVKEALNLNLEHNLGWTECSGAVGQAFRARNSKPSVQLLPDLLSQIPVTLFSGAEDLICNHLGTEEFIENLHWNGGKGFGESPGSLAPRREWIFEGEKAGFWQSARNLTYVLFYNASHMVPFDLPRRSRDMLDRVMGLDVTQLGLLPAESKLDGEEGFHSAPNTCCTSAGAAEGEESDDVEEARWEAYRRSAVVVLVIVAIAAAVWGWLIWRDRKKRKGYQGIPTSGDGAGGRISGTRSPRGLEGFRNKRRGNQDLEAGDFVLAELDDLHTDTPGITPSGAATAAHESMYDIAGDSEDDEDEKKNKKRVTRNGRTLG